MTKEKEAEKIMLVYERIARHIVKKHEYRLKENRKTLEEDLKSCETEDERSHAVDYKEIENAINYWKASDALDAIYLFAQFMREALNIKDLKEKERNIYITKEMEAREKMISREIDEQAEMEKMIKLPEEDPESEENNDLFF